LKLLLENAGGSRAEQRRDPESRDTPSEQGRTLPQSRDTHTDLVTMSRHLIALLWAATFAAMCVIFSSPAGSIRVGGSVSSLDVLQSDFEVRPTFHHTPPPLPPLSSLPFFASLHSTPASRPERSSPHSSGKTALQGLGNPRGGQVALAVPQD